MLFLFLTFVSCSDPDPSPALPVRFFYVVHVHVSDEDLPWLDPEHTVLDEERCRNMVDIGAGIARTLGDRGMQAAWSFLAGSSSGFRACNGDALIQDLVEGGHEISVHTHADWDIPETVAELTDGWGLEPNSVSGLVVRAVDAGAQAEAVMLEDIASAVDLGLYLSLDNLSPDEENPFGAICDDVLGEGNDMWPETHNLMFPWRPAEDDICAHDPDGPMLLLDHANLSWTLDAQGQKADVVAPEHFAVLEGWLDEALAYVEAERPERTPVWGFVTHLTEFTPGGDASQGSDQGAIDALGDFLDQVRDEEEAGRLVASTPGEIADLIEAETR